MSETKDVTTTIRWAVHSFETYLDVDDAPRTQLPGALGLPIEPSNARLEYRTQQGKWRCHAASISGLRVAFDGTVSESFGLAVFNELDKSQLIPAWVQALVNEHRPA